MKSLAFLFLLGLAIAAEAEPFTYESQAELSTTLDADGDGKLDLLVVDRETGVRQLAMQQADGTFLWLDPASVGLNDVTGLAAGSFTASSSAQGFAVASPHWNRVQVWPAGSVAPTSASPPGLGPNTVVALDIFGGQSGTDGIDDLVIATELDDPAGSGILGASYWNGTTANPNYTITLDAPYLHGNRTRFASTEPWMLAAMQTIPGGSQFITRPVSPIFSGPVVGNLPADSTWAYADFANNGLAQFLFYAPGTSTMTIKPVSGNGPGHFNYSFGAGSSFDFGTPVAEIIVLPKAVGAQLLVIFGDGTTAGIYDFDGTNAPVPREPLAAPAGMKFSLAGALGGGNFLLLNGSGGGLGNSTGWQRWDFNGTQHTLAASGSLPGNSPRTARRANVLVYSGDPNATPDAPLLKVLQAGEWSVTATIQGGILSVATQHSLASAVGLSSSANVSLGGGFAADFPSVNQTGSDASITVLSPAVGPPVGAVSFSPQPGIYHLVPGKALTVSLSAIPDLPIAYRTDASQPWISYDPQAPPQISATTTFRAYAGTPFGNVDSLTPIRMATYTIGDPPPISPPPIIDANHNGLSDAWEQTFGITDPNGDADGDGFTNLDEYRAGTDPLDPNSRPTASDLAGIRLIIRAPGPGAPSGTLFDLAWPASLIGAQLETTTTLANPNSWSPITNPIVTSGSERIHHHPGPAEALRFFRLRQLP